MVRARDVLAAETPGSCGFLLLRVCTLVFSELALGAAETIRERSGYKALLGNLPLSEAPGT